MHFRPGDAADLAHQIRRIATKEAALAGMRVECRREFELRYTAGQNIQMLVNIYRDALGRRHAAAGRERSRSARIAAPAPKTA
jgi:hypothetical protein